MEIPGSETTSSLLSLSNELADSVGHASVAIVAINARERIPSSGVLWQQGIIATAAHTIKRSEEITVMLPDGSTVPARLVGRDAGTDLAVLKLDGVELPAADIGDSAALKVGHLVLAVGRVSESGPSASLGIVSAIGGPWRTWRGGQIDLFIRLDLAIYDGFSGGPLIDGKGRIVGINTSGLSRRSGLTIPTSTVNRVVADLLQHGRIARAYLGVSMQPVQVPNALKERLKLSGSGGVIVLSVEEDGPASRAGLLIGDVLIALDDTPVADTDDVQAALGPERVGQALNASVIRGGELTQVSITVGERPQRGR
jgi:S1-C subfamily serine protease